MSPTDISSICLSHNVISIVPVSSPTVASATLWLLPSLLLVTSLTSPFSMTFTFKFTLRLRGERSETFTNSGLVSKLYYLFLAYYPAPPSQKLARERSNYTYGTLLIKFSMKIRTVLRGGKDLNTCNLSE